MLTLCFLHFGTSDINLAPPECLPLHFERATKAPKSSYRVTFSRAENYSYVSRLEGFEKAEKLKIMGRETQIYFLKCCILSFFGLKPWSYFHLLIVV